MDLLQRILQDGGIRTETEYRLCEHSTFRIGGPAKLALFPKDREEMIFSLRTLAAYGARYTVIGNASNVVFDDRGYDGAILFTEEYDDIEYDFRKNHLIACSGASTASVANQAMNLSRGGVEFMQGIPGTVGGAVYMNAGAYDGCMADVCEWSEYYDTNTGKIGVFEGDAQEFGIRSSIYQKHPEYIILSATFVRPRKEMRQILMRMQTFAKRRRESQPLNLPSAGSVFKRPIGYFAGKLIDECGMKGVRIGGAQVSEKHAGFIVNRGGATSNDVKELVELIRETVFQRTGVMLECEIQFIEYQAKSL